MAAALPRGPPLRHICSTAILCLFSPTVIAPARGERLQLSFPQVGTISHKGRVGATSPKEASGRAEPDTTVVVLKSYGYVNPWVDFLIARYSKQLARAGIRLHVLLDVSSLAPEMTSPRKATYTPLWGGDSPDTPLCEVTWSAAEHLIRVLAKEKHSWIPTQHSMTTVFEMLWWEHCFPREWRKKRHFVWFLEEDTFFNGDLASFVGGFLGEDTDYIARGFRIASPVWWMYSQFADAFERGLGKVTAEDDVVKNVWPLPEMNEGKCCLSDPIYDTWGLLFAQEHVVRYSSRLLGMMRDAAARGIIGPGEALKGTLCASGLGLGRGEVCSMWDIAPIREDNRANATAGNWISPVYCWHQPSPVPGRTDAHDMTDLPCSEEWRNKWVHPVKVASPALRLHEC